jgi:hypothetical protein
VFFYDKSSHWGLGGLQPLYIHAYKHQPTKLKGKQLGKLKKLLSFLLSKAKAKQQRVASIEFKSHCTWDGR